jgi:hypothetical protein
MACRLHFVIPIYNNFRYAVYSYKLQKKLTIIFKCPLLVFLTRNSSHNAYNHLSLLRLCHPIDIR